MARTVAFFIVLPLCLPIFAQTPGQKSDSSLAPRSASRPLAVVDSFSALRRVLTSVDFAEAPLEVVLEQFAHDMRVNIVVRWNRLEAAGLESDTPVTLSLRTVTFGEALRLVLGQVADDEELAYRVSPEKILISTLADINSEIVTRVYDVRDLTLQSVEPSLFIGKEFTYVASVQPVVDENAVAPQPIIGRLPIGVSLGGPNSPEFDLNTGTFDLDNQDEDEEDQAPGSPGTIEELINVIVATVEPESWVANGGRGTIVPFKGQLVVRNSIYVHQLLAGSAESRHAR